MNAIACAIVLAALIRGRLINEKVVTDWHVVSMSALLGYFLFWGN